MIYSAPPPIPPLPRTLRAHGRYSRVQVETQVALEWSGSRLSQGCQRLGDLNEKDQGRRWIHATFYILVCVITSPSYRSFFSIMSLSLLCCAQPTRHSQGCVWSLSPHLSPSWFLPSGDEPGPSPEEAGLFQSVVSSGPSDPSFCLGFPLFLPSRSSDLSSLPTS